VIELWPQRYAIKKNGELKITLTKHKKMKYLSHSELKTYLYAAFEHAQLICVEK
jgi:hypothetical protein